MGTSRHKAIKIAISAGLVLFSGAFACGSFVERVGARRSVYSVLFG